MATPSRPASAAANPQQLWNPAASTGTGLQLPAAKGNQAASTSKTAEAADRATNVDTLLDAVGASGVNIDAEEETLRSDRASAQQSTSTAPLAPGADRSRRQDFIDPSALAEAVKKVAAAFQLRTLEPDTIPLIALATRHRLASLISESIAARDHRNGASHLRPPPFTNKRQRQADDFDFGFVKRAKEAQEPAWDTVVYSDAEKLLAVLERVDREEERRARRERMLREEKEEQERIEAEAAKESEAASKIDLSSGGVDGLVTGVNASQAGGEETIGKDGKKKKEPRKRPKKEKELNATAAARNMSEDVQKRLTDHTAMSSLGGKKYGWLSGVGTAASAFTPAIALPKPKFAPGGSLSEATTSGTSTPKPALPPPTFAPAASTSGPIDALSRLAGVPPMHDANREREAKEEWEKSRHTVELSDMLFALDRERGMGVGKAKGTQSLLKCRAGIMPRKS